MNPHLGATQEIMENIDSDDTMLLIYITKVINVTAIDRLVDSGDLSREAQADTETTRAIIMNSHAHQLVSASETDIHDRITNIHVPTHHYATYHVLDVAGHNIHLQIENVLHHLNVSRGAR